VTSSYESGHALSKIGVVFAGDMIVECALAKLSYLLGKYSDREKVKAMIVENICGEQTNYQAEYFSLHSNAFINSLLKVMKLDGGEKENVMLAKTLMPTVINELVEKNQIEMLKKLKNEIKSLNSKDFTKRNPLHIAAINGNLEATEFLIKCNVNVKELDDLFNTPLNYACLRKHKVVAMKIKESGGILNMRGEFGDLFCKLAFENDLETLRLFYLCGANLMTGNYDLRTLAHIAAAEGKLDIIKFLIDEVNVNIMISDRWGNTPYDDAFGEVKDIIGKKFKKKKKKIKKATPKLINKTLEEVKQSDTTIDN